MARNAIYVQYPFQGILYILAFNCLLLPGIQDIQFELNKITRDRYTSDDELNGDDSE